jgi:hypothetical protein
MASDRDKIIFRIISLTPKTIYYKELCDNNPQNSEEKLREWTANYLIWEKLYEELHMLEHEVNPSLNSFERFIISLTPPYKP